MDNATIVCYVGGLCFVPASSVTGPFSEGSADDHNAMIMFDGGYRWIKLTDQQVEEALTAAEKIRNEQGWYPPVRKGHDSACKCGRCQREDREDREFLRTYIGAQ